MRDDEPILTNNIIDSLGSLRMIDFLETAFPLTIEDTDMLPENFQTLNDCEIFINRKLGISVSASENGAEELKVVPTPARARAFRVTILKAAFPATATGRDRQAAAPQRAGLARGTH